MILESKSNQMNCNRIWLLFFYITWLLFFYGCNSVEPEKQSLNENTFAIEEELIIQNLAKYNEQYLKNLERDFFRMSISYSNAQESFTFTVIDFGHEYLISEKTVFPPDWKSYSSKGELLPKDELGFSIYDLVSSLGRLGDADISGGIFINDGGVWSVEYRLDSMYTDIDGFLYKDLDSLRSRFYMRPFRFPKFGVKPK